MRRHESETTAKTGPAPTLGIVGVGRLVRPHWRLLTAAFAGMLVESAASLWEPDRKSTRLNSSH